MVFGRHLAKCWLTGSFVYFVSDTINEYYQDKKNYYPVVHTLNASHANSYILPFYLGTITDTGTATGTVVSSLDNSYYADGIFFRRVKLCSVWPLVLINKITLYSLDKVVADVEELE